MSLGTAVMVSMILARRVVIVGRQEHLLDELTASGRPVRTRERGR